MTFPRVPMTIAETHVDWAAHQNHIDERRAAVERAALPTVRRIATGASHGLLPASAQTQIAKPFQRSLEATVRFGYREARREITALRSTATITAYEIPDAGQSSQAAIEGIEGALRLARRRASQAAAVVVSAIHAAAVKSAAMEAAGEIGGLAQLLSAANRVVHRVTLELVGETLNLGRTTGALSFAKPPEFALRSEQLDKNTCPRCDELHGFIAQIGSAAFYANSPPTHCFGGGRCRGIWIFGDSASDVEQEVAA